MRIIIKKLLFTQSNEAQKKVHDHSPFFLIDYEGPLTYSSLDSALHADKISISKDDIVTIIYSCEYDSDTTCSEEEGYGTGHKEWLESDCGIIFDESKKKNHTKYFQLWTCLPKKENTDPKNHDALITLKVPVIELPKNSGHLKIIAGNFLKTQGPVQGPPDLNIWDMRIKKGAKLKFSVPENQSTFIFVLSGEITLEDGQVITGAELGVLERDGNSISLIAGKNSSIIFLGGDPINEPTIGYNKFALESISQNRHGVNFK